MSTDTISLSVLTRDNGDQAAYVFVCQDGGQPTMQWKEESTGGFDVCQLNNLLEIAWSLVSSAMVGQRVLVW